MIAQTYANDSFKNSNDVKHFNPHQTDSQKGRIVVSTSKDPPGAELTVYSLPLPETRSTANTDLAATKRLSKESHFDNKNSEPDEIRKLLSSEANQKTAYYSHRKMRDKLENNFEKIFKQRSFTVDVLAICFGIGTWVGINGTFIQLPLLVEVAPEGWSLPSYLSLMVQIGNLGPILYTMLQKFFKLNDAYLIYGLLLTGTISAILTAFFFSRTADLFGAEHSVALFALTFFTALTACTSSVLFMPYMGRFKEMYLVTYFIGEGLSGLLPSVVALIQGIGGTTECILQKDPVTGAESYEKYVPPPRFGTKEFFFFVFAMMLVSFVGFLLLDRLKLSKREYAAVQVTHGNNYKYERNDDKIVGETTTTTTDTATAPENGNSMETPNNDLVPEISKGLYVFLLLLIGVVSFFANGIFNSIQSYSTLPYGSQAYHLSATLSVIANPVACFLAVFLPHTSLRSILTLTGLASILTIFVFITAAMSPVSPLHGTTIGIVLIIACWTLLQGLISYVKLCITTIMRSQGGKSLVWTGGLTQLGSTFGSVLIFVLINYTNSFTSAPDEC